MQSDPGNPILNANGISQKNFEESPFKEKQQSEDSTITRTFTIRNKKYTYSGPVNKEIDELLLDLEGLSGEINGMVGKIDNFDKEVESRLSFKNIQISAGGIIVTIVYWSAYFATLSESIVLYLVIFQTLLSDSEISTNSTKYDIVTYLPLYCFLYTLFTQISQQIKSVTIWIALFPFLVIIPLFVLLDYHFNLFNSYPDTNYDYQGMAFVILTMSIYVNSLLTRLIINWFTKQLSYFIANIMATQFCLLIAYGIVFKLIIYIIATHTNKVNIITQDIRDIIAPPLFFIMLYVSITIIYRLFKKQPNLIIRDLEILKFAKQNIEKEDTLSIYLHNFLDKIQFKWIAPSIFVLLYIILELYAYGSLVSEMSQNSIALNRVVGFGFLVGFIPLFVIFGIIISSSKTQFININLWVPLVLGAGFSILTIKLWGIFDNVDNLKSVAQLVGICPLIVCVIWISISYFRSERNTLKLGAITLCCYFLAFPLGFLITLSFIYNDNSYSQAGYIMIYVGILIFAIFIIYFCILIAKKLLKLPEQSKTLNFKEYMYYNLKDYATWLNSICFMISFFLICYFVWNTPATATGTKKGAMQGLLVLHPILFILINVVLRLKSIDQDSETEIEMKDKKKQLKIHQLITFCTLVPFIVLLPIGLTQDDETTKNTLITVAIGVPFVFQLFSLFLYIKNQSINYQDFFQPFIIILCWAFVIAPFGVIMPILADYYENSSSSFAIFAQVAVAFGLIVCILGVTGTSLFFSVLLNKEYLELKKREVLKKVIQVFTNYSVSSDQGVCSLMFMRYVRENDPPKLISNMKQGDPVNVLDYNGTHKEMFNKVLVKKREYDNFKGYPNSKKELDDSMNSNNDKDPSQRTTGQMILYYAELLAEMVLDCFFCRCGLEDLEHSEELLRQKDAELQLLEEQRQHQLNKGKLKLPDEQFNKQLKRNDFYCSLQVKSDRVEKFWACMFNKYQNDVTVLFTLLGIQIKEEELKEYESYSNSSSGMISLSENDFAEILKLYIIQDGKTAFDSLWMLAIRKYPYFIYNFEDLKPMLKIPLRHETAFSINNFKSSVKIDLKRKNNKFLTTKTTMIINDDNNFKDEDYINRYNEIIAKYNVNPSSMKMNLWKFFGCLHKWIWVKPTEMASEWLTKMAQQLNFQILPTPQGVVSAQYKPWEEIAEQSSTTLVEACDLFDQDMLNKEFQFKMNFTNILTFCLRIYDIYGLATLAFDSQVGWFGDNQTFDPISTVDGSAVFSSYNFYFFIAFTMCIAYAVFGREAVSQISNNTFGLDRHGNPIPFTHPRFWLSKVIILISGQFIFVMKTFIDAFICDYTNYPYTLVRSTSLECMSDLHFMYVILAFFGAFIYYPLSTFLQPTFQFADHSLDLKYKSTYVVIYIQAKLLILGISSVFSNLQAQAYQYQMLFASIIMLLLIIVYLKMMPCYVKWFNTLELTLYAIVFNCYFGAFLILLTGTKQVGWIFTGIMIGIILIYLIYRILFQKEKAHSSQVKIQPVKEDLVSIIQDIQ